MSDGFIRDDVTSRRHEYVDQQRNGIDHQGNESWWEKMPAFEILRGWGPSMNVPETHTPESIDLPTRERGLIHSLRHRCRIQRHISDP